MATQNDSLQGQSSAPRSNVPDEWHVVRGIAQGIDRRLIEPRRVLLTLLIAMLAVGSVIGVLIIGRAINDRLPMLTSAARAEVTALATRFRTKSVAKVAARAHSSNERDRQPVSRSRHVRVKDREVSDPDLDQLGPNAPFDAYLLVGGRRFLLRSGSRMALLDMRTGRIEWIGDDSAASR
jgi:hypothetical protein